MNTHVDFEIAKLLKEKGFDIPVLSYYDGDRFCLNYSIINQYIQEYIEDKGDCLIIPYTSGEGSLYLETINFNGWGVNNYSAPTIAEVVMWLYEKHGIWISVNYKLGHFVPTISKGDLKSIKIKDWNLFPSIGEAYLEAIKYCLTNLVKI